MTGPRTWIAVLAGVSFLAGLAGGILVGPGLAPAQEVTRPFSDYERLLVDRFALEDDQVRALRAVLDRYHRDLQDLRADSSDETEVDRIRLGRLCRDRIKTYVLAEGVREEFDRLASGTLPSAPVGTTSG